MRWNRLTVSCEKLAIEERWNEKAEVVRQLPRVKVLSECISVVAVM
jgi:hypothetical protein